MLPAPASKISLYSSVNAPEFRSAPRMPWPGQAWITASRTVMSWASLNTQVLLPPRTSKPSNTTWFERWNLMVWVPPWSTGRVVPGARFQRMITGLPGAPPSSSPTTALP